MPEQRPPSSGERRKERRAPAEVSVTLASSTGEPIAASTRNLSGSGAYIILDEPLPLFARYHVHLLLPSTDDEGQPAVDDIELTAIVVRHDPVVNVASGPCHCMALYFDHISAQDRKRIIDFVDAQFE